MKLICTGKHWKIKYKQLVFDSPEGREHVQRAIDAAEARTRLEIYEQIMTMDFTDNRKVIVKSGLNKIPKIIQRIIANKILASESTSDYVPSSTECGEKQAVEQLVKLIRES